MKYARGYAPLFFCFIVLLSAFSFTSNFALLTYYDFHRWILVFALVWLPIVFFSISSKRRYHVSVTIFIWVLSYFLYLLKGIYFNDLSAMLDPAMMIVAAFAVVLLSMSLKGLSLKIFISGVNIVVFVYYCRIFLEYLYVMASPIHWDIHTLAVGFDNVRFVNQFQVFVFPVAVYGILYFKSLSRFISLVVGVITVAFLFYSSARGALLSSVLISVFVAVCYIKLKHWSEVKRLSLVLVGIWVAGFFIYYVAIGIGVNSLFERGVSIDSHLSSNARLEAWAEALSLWRKGMWVGHGGMSYSDPSFNFSYSFAHPHNSLIQVLFEYGLLGLLVTVFVILSILLRALVYIRDSGCYDTEYVFVFCGLFSGIGLSLVSGVIVMPVSQLFLILFMGAVVSRLSFSRVVWVSPGWFVRDFTILICVVVGLLSFFSYYATMLGDTLVMDSGPRYWIVGRHI